MEIKSAATFRTQPEREEKRIMSFNTEPSMTKQNLAENLDVNNIIKRYNQTGVLQQAYNFEGIYGEFTSYDLRQAMDKTLKANELFMDVPSDIRAYFKNDAGAFIDFATNKDNIKQMRDWGLAPPEYQEPKPAPIEVIVTNPQT